MASRRYKTKYPGIFYREVSRVGGSGMERVYYAIYKVDGKVVETKIGRQYADDMTPARAANIRGELIEGKRITRQQAREEAKAEASKMIWSISSLWEEYKRRNPNVKGLTSDQNRFDNHLTPLHQFEPKAISTSTVDDLRLSLTQKGLKAATVRNVLELLRRIISFGIKKVLINPADAHIHFEMPQLNNIKTEDLTPSQLKNLLSALDSTTHKKAASMMKLALFSGMRRGEMFNLKWEHIDWERGFINLVGQDDGLGAKSGQIERIPLNEMARSLLCSIEKNTSPYVFPGKKGGRLVDIRREADAIKKEAGLPKDFRPFHGLRHVYASMLASSGKVTMYELQKLMTHKSPAMTQRYAHLRDEALKKASGVMRELLSTINN